MMRKNDLSLGGGYFNKKFKDYLRNLYVYGCLEREEFPDNDKNYQANINRFEQIGFIPLAGWDGPAKHQTHRWDLSGTPRCRRLTTSDCRTLSRNPAHIFYHYYSTSGIDAVFFLTVILQAACVRQRDLEEAKELELFRKRGLEVADITEGFTSSDILGWVNTALSAQAAALDEKEAKKIWETRSRQIRNRLQEDFERIGLLSAVQKGNSFYWAIHRLTMDRLLGTVQQKAHSLLAAISFFSKTGPFGEAGTLLLDRLNAEEQKETEQYHIHLKQFYLAKSLNDFNMADLLQAIEGDSWVLITYYHYFNPRLQGCIFCKPLQIRSSTANGREYISYYDPVFRRVHSQRLDQIQSVEILAQPYAVWMAATARGWSCICRFNGEKSPVLLWPCAFSCGDHSLRRFAQYENKGTRIKASLRYKTEPEAADSHVFPAARLVSTALSPEFQAELDRDLKHSDELLNQTWGVSIPYYSPDQTLWDVKLTEIRLTLRLQPNERFILNRLYRERRIGSAPTDTGHGQQVVLQVTDPLETVPWIISFAGRIHCLECSDPAFVPFIRKRLRDIFQTVCGHAPDGLSPLAGHGTLRKQHFHNSNILRSGSKQAHEGWLTSPSPLISPVSPLHDHLYTKLFSAEYCDCIQAFQGWAGQIGEQVKAVSGRERSLHEEALWKKHLSTQPFNLLDSSCLQKLSGDPDRKKDRYTAKEYLRILRQIPAVCDAGFQLSAAHGSNLLLMRNIIPLSILERRWLLAILEDKKMRLFLSEKDIHAYRRRIQEGLPEPLTPLYRKKDIICYDQYIQKPLNDHFCLIFRIFQTAIREEKALKIIYRPQGTGAAQEWDIRPLWLEYSPRDDLFRAVCCRWYTDGQATQTTLRLDFVEKAIQPDYRLSVPADFPGPRQIQFKIRFPDERNLPDRILTEFAPFKKQCTYLAAQEQYELTFEADQAEWLDIAVHILSFGPSIQILEPQELLEELQARLLRQKDVWM